MSNRVRLWWIAVAIAMVMGTGQTVAFGKTLVLASAMDGRLVDGEGRPAAGVRITRSWSWAWTGRTGSDIATTQEDGRFHFDAVTGASFMASVLPHQPSVRQVFRAELEDGVLEFLSLDKGNYDADGELNGQRLNVNCRTDLEPGPDGLFWGTCTYAE